MQIDRGRPLTQEENDGISYGGFDIRGWTPRSWVGLVPRYLALLGFGVFIFWYADKLTPTSFLYPTAENASATLVEGWLAGMGLFVLGGFGLFWLLLALETLAKTGFFLAGYVYVKQTKKLPKR